MTPSADRFASQWAHHETIAATGERVLVLGNIWGRKAPWNDHSDVQRVPEDFEQHLDDDLEPPGTH